MRCDLMICVVMTASVGCFHHQPPLPATIPAVDGKPVTMFSLRYVDMGGGNRRSHGSTKVRLRRVYGLADERDEVRLIA